MKSSKLERGSSATGAVGHDLKYTAPADDSEMSPNVDVLLLWRVPPPPPGTVSEWLRIELAGELLADSAGRLNL